MRQWKLLWVPGTSIAIFAILLLTQFSPVRGQLAARNGIAAAPTASQVSGSLVTTTPAAQNPNDGRGLISANAHRFGESSPSNGPASPGSSSLPASSSTPNIPGVNGSGWVLTFSDEFDGAVLDHNKWATEYGFDTGCVVANPPTSTITYCNRSNNNEKEWYIDTAPRVGNGVLKLFASKNDCSGDNLPDRNYAPYSCANFPYLSGMISTHSRFSQLYGYFESRMKVPNGQGFWPAFWLIPQLPPSPSADVEYFWPPEIDIMENRGDRPDKVQMTHHFSEVFPDPGSKLNNWSYGGSDTSIYTNPNPPDFSAGFHAFAVDWEPDGITWYVDGVERFRSTIKLPPGKVNPPLYPGDMHIILNLAVGGGFTGNLLPDDGSLPASLEVDYVRAYQKARSFLFLPTLMSAGQ
jgi:beta-glucanase (GH16 family)